MRAGTVSQFRFDLIFEHENLEGRGLSESEFFRRLGRIIDKSVELEEKLLQQTESKTTQNNQTMRKR